MGTIDTDMAKLALGRAASAAAVPLSGDDIRARMHPDRIATLMAELSAEDVEESCYATVYSGDRPTAAGVIWDGIAAELHPWDIDGLVPAAEAEPDGELLVVVSVSDELTAEE